MEVRNIDKMLWVFAPLKYPCFGYFLPDYQIEYIKIIYRSDLERMLKEMDTK
jgi:hypothetical protein